MIVFFMTCFEGTVTEEHLFMFEIWILQLFDKSFHRMITNTYFTLPLVHSDTLNNTANYLQH